MAKSNRTNQQSQDNCNQGQQQQPGHSQSGTSQPTGDRSKKK